MKVPFSLIVFIGYLWTEVVSVMTVAFSNENRYYVWTEISDGTPFQ